MKQGFFEIVSNERLTDNVMELVLRGDTSEIAVPGQFVNIKLDGFFSAAAAIGVQLRAGSKCRCKLWRYGR